MGWLVTLWNWRGALGWAAAVVIAVVAIGRHLFFAGVEA